MKKWTILLLALLCSTAGAAAQDFSVVNPRCEYRDEPLGINTLTPRFSWQISACDRGFLQSAYELIVGDDRAAVAAGRGNLWRVKTKGAESLHIPYAGKALESGKEYYWSVRVWNAAGEVSPWMPVNRFSTGLMSPDAWSGARWIAMEVQPDSLRLVPGEEYNKLTIGDRITAPNRLPQFRREIDVRKPVKRAMAYVSGLGQFEFFINGDKVGDNFLDPAWSDYDKIVCYVPFDVTDRLQQGANVLGVMLGNGMYNVPRERYYKLLMTYGYPMMICKVDVEYADGTHDVIVSDGSWRTTTSPVTYSSIFGGEDYDATLERTGWMKPGYDDSSWQEVLFTSQRGELIAPKALPVKVMEEFPVFKIRKTKYGKWLYDMGQNFSGVACLTVKGKRGQAVRMNTCELFDPAVDSIQIHGGYRGETRYTYTLRGDAEPESWAPQFTYHGFRYVLIDGAVPAGEPNPEGLPEIVDVRGLHIRNVCAELGGDGVREADPVEGRFHSGIVVVGPTRCGRAEDGGNQDNRCEDGDQQKADALAPLFAGQQQRRRAGGYRAHAHSCIPPMTGTASCSPSCWAKSARSFSSRRLDRPAASMYSMTFPVMRRRSFSSPSACGPSRMRCSASACATKRCSSGDRFRDIVSSGPDCPPTTMYRAWTLLSPRIAFVIAEEMRDIRSISASLSPSVLPVMKCSVLR